MTKQNTTVEKPEDFKNMLDLMAVYSAASHSLEEMGAEINNMLLELIDDKRADYANLQKALTESETALEHIALSHPEWFADARSVKTPYGVVKFHRSTKTVVKNEEVTFLLVKQHAEKNPDFDLSLYIQTSEALNIEALEKLDPALLKAFRINRVESDNFSVTPAKVNLGKAVKEAAEEKKAA